MLLTNRCAAYCRFCFRKRLVGVETEEVLDDVDRGLAYIAEHREINNVLVSGGDPFILDTEILEHVLQGLNKLDHLRFIRFGTRTPVVLPSRILKDPSLIALLKKYSRPDRRLYIVTHFNHPNEFTDKSIKAVGELINAGVVVNNQTTLLKHIHDDPAVLAEVQNRLTEIGVNPYYVFQCRPVKRVKEHFQFSLKRGFEIVEEARKQLNGVAKRFRYCMSHDTGKIEILGLQGSRMFFKYHQARDEARLGNLFSIDVDDTAGWLEPDPLA
jgi:KamA family protein